MRGFSTQRLVSLLAAFLALYCLGCVSSPDPEPVHESRVHNRAAWSPDGLTIAFLANINDTLGIYAVDSSGSNRRLVYAGDTGGPTWSPDSRWLAFSQMLSLRKIRITGDSLKQITTGGSDIRPSWSRDGNTIAFVRLGIWMLIVANDSVYQLTTTGDFPSWHPNGNDVVLMVASGGGTVFTFYAVQKDSATARSILSIGTAGLCSFPSISPNGQELLFSLTPIADLTQLWKVDLVSQEPTKLTEDGGDFGAWSPDGEKIVYTRTAFGDGALWIMNKDGSGKKQLTGP